MTSATQLTGDGMSFLATGRTSDLFLPDLEQCTDQLRARISGARILIVGGAGSIGAATISLLAKFKPQTLHVVDQSENKLAELVRDLRSAPGEFAIDDFRTFPLDYGSLLMHRLLKEIRQYDLVFNFAALKHVRSEKDAYSLLQMLDTNVLKAARFLSWLAERSLSSAYFCVSTDKAANPTSLMGASKRIMEHVIFSEEAASALPHVTSARFANVAFSDGSLLDSFLKRIQHRRVLGVPKDTRRYFLSLSEAGQICLLAAVVCPHRHFLIPKLDPSRNLVDLQSVACAVIHNFRYEPKIYQDPAEAKAGAESDIKNGRYPLLLTPRDTGGEKAFEEFLGDGETMIDSGLPNLAAVQYKAAPSGSLRAFLQGVEELISGRGFAASKSEIVELISQLVPELRHFASDKNLDERI